MSKSKIDFLADILSHKKMSPSLKERFFILATDEIKKINHSDSELSERVRKIEDELYKTRKKINSPKSDSKEVVPIELPKYIDPRNTARFLNTFNQNPILKSTSHLIDSSLLQSINEILSIPNYNFDFHIQAIQREYYKLSNNYKNVNKGLKGKIGEFLNSYTKSGWSDDKITISWSSNEIKKWCDQNSQKCPNPDGLDHLPCEISRITLKSGEFLNNFNDVVLHFKKQIEFRLNNSLFDTVKRLNRDYSDRIDFNINAVRPNIIFYSDVEKVKQAYIKIIDMCLENSKITGDRPNIILSLKEEQNELNETTIIFSILHRNSVFGKTARALLDRYGEKTTSIIKNQINGLCEWKLKADFGNKEFADLSLWPKKDNFKSLEKFDGVQFELIFYRLS